MPSLLFHTQTTTAPSLKSSSKSSSQNSLLSIGSDWFIRKGKEILEPFLSSSPSHSPLSSTSDLSSDQQKMQTTKKRKLEFKTPSNTDKTENRQLRSSTKKLLLSPTSINSAESQSEDFIIWDKIEKIIIYQNDEILLNAKEIKLPPIRTLYQQQQPTAEPCSLDSPKKSSFQNQQPKPKFIIHKRNETKQLRKKRKSSTLNVQQEGYTLEDFERMHHKYEMFEKRLEKREKERLQYEQLQKQLEEEKRQHLALNGILAVK